MTQLTRHIAAVVVRRGLAALGATAFIAMVVGTGVQFAFVNAHQAEASVNPPLTTWTRAVETTLQVSFAAPTHTAVPCGPRAVYPCS